MLEERIDTERPAVIFLSRMGDKAPRRVVEEIRGFCAAERHDACPGEDDIRGTLRVCVCDCHKGDALADLRSQLLQAADLLGLTPEQVELRILRVGVRTISRMSGDRDSLAAWIHALRAVGLQE